MKKEETDPEVWQAVRASKKRARSASRAEGAIIIDALLDEILPQIQDAVLELRREMTGTDWIRNVVVGSVDKDELQKRAGEAARREIMRAQLPEIEA